MYNKIMELNEIFSKNLIRLRKLRGFSQRELASRTGLTQRIINHYENKPKSVPVDKLKTLAESLNARVSDFFNEEENNPLDTIDIRWIKKINEIMHLSPAAKKELNRHINYLIDKEKLDETNKIEK